MLCTACLFTWQSSYSSSRWTRCCCKQVLLDSLIILKGEPSEIYWHWKISGWNWYCHPHSLHAYINIVVGCFLLIKHGYRKHGYKKHIKSAFVIVIIKELFFTYDCMHGAQMCWWTKWPNRNDLLTGYSSNFFTGRKNANKRSRNNHSLPKNITNHPTLIC